MKRLALILALLCAPAFASLSEITGAECSAVATTCTIGSHQYGDLEVTFAYRSASATAPSLPAGYTSINSGSNSTNSALSAWRFLDGTETVTGTFTNATSVQALIFRGADITSTGPIGGNALGGASSAVVSYTTLTMTRSDGTSWVVGFDGCASCTAGNNAPSGMTLRTGGGANKFAGSSTAGAVSSWATTTVTVTTTGLWRSQTVEILAAPAASATLPHVQGIDSGHAAEANTTPFTYTLPIHTGTLASNLYLLAVTVSNTVTLSTPTDNQSNTWVLGPTINDTGNLLKTYLYHVCGGAAGVTAVTVTASAASSDFAFEFEELNNIATSSCTDGSGVGANTGPTNNALMTAGALAPSQSGDLLYQYCINTINGIETDIPSRIYIPGNNTFTSVNQIVGTAGQAIVETGSGSVSLYQQQMGLNTGGNCVAQAFKSSAGAGTAPTGMYIAHTTFVPATNASPYSEAFAAKGNLIVIGTSQIATGWNTTPTDSQGNTYTLLTPGTSTDPKFAFAPNATTTDPLLISLTWATAQTPFYMIFDVVGANTSPLDTSISCSSPSSLYTGSGNAVTVATQNYGCINTPTQSGTNPIADCADITPSTSSGIVFDICAYGTGPSSTASAPTGFVNDFAFYPGKTDGSLLDRGDAYGHLFVTSTSAENWTWTMQNGAGGTSAFGFAMHFLAPAGAAALPGFNKRQKIEQMERGL